MTFPEKSECQYIARMSFCQLVWKRKKIFHFAFTAGIVIDASFLIAVSAASDRDEEVN